jgi:hypothetical protein
LLFFSFSFLDLAGIVTRVQLEDTKASAILVVEVAGYRLHPCIVLKDEQATKIRKQE